MRTFSEIWQLFKTGHLFRFSFQVAEIFLHVELGWREISHCSCFGKEERHKEVKIIQFLLN